MHSASYTRRLNAVDVVRNYYAELVCSEVHPGNLGPLPPGPGNILSKAWLLDIIAPHHRWVIEHLST